MPLKLEIISEHRDIVGDDAVRDFDEQGGTIGRALDNDWILPDPDRYISSRHATIDYKGGMYYLADTSTNGVYVNGEREPVGKGNPRRLFNGDQLRMGDFEFVVAIDRGESIAMPLEGAQTAVPEPMEAMVPEESLRSGVQLLDEEELADRHDFARLLASDTPAPVSNKAGKPQSRRPPIERALPKPAADPEFSAEFATDLSPTALEVTANDLFDSFLDGLGLSRADLHDGAEPAEVLQNAGAVFRAFVEGSVQMLASRRNLKAAFKLDQTMTLPRHNNPLKLSEDVAVLLRQLLAGHGGEYLGPVEAAREVCRDLLYHQQALVDAMHAAFAEFSERFDPDELVAAFHRDGTAASRFAFLARLKYWQLYCDRYPLLTEKGANRIPQLVSDDYVRAYERQIAEYKRLEVVPDLKATVRWRAPAPADVPAVAEAKRDTNEHANPDADLIPSIEFDDTFSDLFDDDDVASG
jgi:type VI secretion system protein